MTDAIPTTLLYGQALVYLQELSATVTSGVLQNQNDFSMRLREILTRFERTAGVPLLTYEPFDDTEPPLSSKMNRLWNMANHDVSLLQNQVDVLRAAVVDTYNNTVSALSLATNENLQLANQLSTLQLYSNSVDPTIITFSDNFGSADYIDNSSIPGAEQTSIINGYLTLGQNGPLNNLSPNAKVKILNTSNGVPGNNQEINLAASSTTKVSKAATKTEPHYVFYAESNRAATLPSITDGQPNTWFEYEIYLINEADRKRALNLNLGYIWTHEDGRVTSFDWSHGPPKTPNVAVPTLKLDLEFDLQSSQSVNSITYNPYGLRDNSNLPVLVRLVEISTDGATWVPLNPTNVWITSNPNLQSARVAPNVSSTATWNFEQQVIRYVRFHLEQPNKISAPIGHLWYTKRQDKKTKTKTTHPPRVIGPKPKYGNPSAVLAANKSATSALIQHREKFQGARWAIAIRGINIQQIQYQPDGTMITPPLHVGGVVDRISLNADISIPPSWPTDQAWVQFFVSPDGGTSWFPISRIQDDFLGVPEIVAFNDPIPEQFKESGVAYYDVAGTVDTLLLKILLTSPPGNIISTPIVNSYELKVKKRV